MESAIKNEEGDWEVRPGGMLVQKRDPDAADGGGGGGNRSKGTSSNDGGNIKIKVSYGSSNHEVLVPAHSTFGDVKRVIAQETGLEPKDQRLFFRGKEMDDKENLHIAGMKNLSKLLLLEDQESKETKLEETKMSEEILRGCSKVAQVRAEVDKLSEKVAALERDVCGGTKVAEKEFIVLGELLTRELLKLDAIEAVGEAKVQRKNEVRRIQTLEKTLDTLKERNLKSFRSRDNVASVTTEWETFESGVGSLSAPPPMSSSSNKTQDWQQFD